MRLKPSNSLRELAAFARGFLHIRTGFIGGGGGAIGGFGADQGVR